MIQFRELKEFKRGTVYKLLCESYSELLNLLPDYSAELKSSWRAEDDNAFNLPDSIGKCILISMHNNDPIGFVSWDPRKIPEEGIIGQNCIVPSHRGKGFGKIQIRKVMEIFFSDSARLIKATTANLPFFIPAHKTYLSCGFKIESRSFTKAFGGMELINFYYRKDVK
jgi:RimJ/RimL family protein N-acetyltransferase